MTRSYYAVPCGNSLRNIQRAVDHARERVTVATPETEIFLPLDVVIPDPHVRTRSFVLPEGTKVLFGDEPGLVAKFIGSNVLGADGYPIAKSVTVYFYRNSRVRIETE